MADQTDAFAALRDALVSYLGDQGTALADWMVAQWEAGVPQAQIAREVREQPAYRARFPGMAHLSGIGQAVSEQQYIEAEREYRSAMSALGPAYQQYYSTEFIGRLISGDVNPAEVTQRVARAQEYIYSTAPRSVVEALRNEYGMTHDDLVAYVLDPETVGAQMITEFDARRARAEIRGAAADAGMSVTADQADAIAARNYTYGNSSEKFQNAKINSATLSQLAAIANGSITDDEVLAAEFSLAGGDKAKKKIKGLASQERARFSGSSGLGRSSLGSRGLGSQ